MDVKKYPNYEEYKKTQTEWNKNKLNNVWIQESTVEAIKTFTGPRKWILCHGTRRGAEQIYFKKHFGGKVWGTEISDTASQFPRTIQWDFHEIKPEWMSFWDLVYSNSLDHAYDPRKAIKNWLLSIKNDGYVIIEWSGDNEHNNSIDPFRATLEELKKLIEDRNTGGRIVHQIDLVPKKEKYRYQCLLFVQKYTHPELTAEELESKTKMIVEIATVLNSINAEYYLGGSSLLGLVRDGQIIRHGTGTTIHFKVEEYRRVAEVIVESLTRQGYKLFERQSGGNAKFKMRKGGFVFEFVAWYQGAGREDRYRVRKLYKLPAEIFRPGTELPLNGYPVKVFNPPEEYCFFRYGKNWRTPINSIHREEYETDRYHRHSRGKV